MTTNTWDYRNRLTHITVRDAQNNIVKEAAYTYDVDNRRIGVWVDADGAGSGSATERWTVYDGVNPYADFNASGSLTTRYLYGPAIDQLFARWSASGDVDWYLGDNLGSVRQIVDGDGTVEDNITYDSFGKILSESNPSNGDRFKYTGREWDAVFEQYYYRARYYGPDIGRFTSLDPKGFAAGDANLYRYVENSPTSFVDPTGLQRDANGRWIGKGPEPEPPKPGDDGRGPKDGEGGSGRLERDSTIAVGIVVSQILLTEIPKDVYFYGMTESTNVLSCVARSTLDGTPIGKSGLYRKLSCKALGIAPTASLGGVIARWGTLILKGANAAGWLYTVGELNFAIHEEIVTTFPLDPADAGPGKDHRISVLEIYAGLGLVQ